MKLKKTSEFYSAHTDKKMKRLGDALLAVSAFSGVPAVLAGHEIIGAILFGCGVIGTFLTRMFKSEE